MTLSKPSHDRYRLKNPRHFTLAMVVLFSLVLNFHSAQADDDPSCDQLRTTCQNTRLCMEAAFFVLPVLVVCGSIFATAKDYCNANCAIPVNTASPLPSTLPPPDSGILGPIAGSLDNASKGNANLQTFTSGITPASLNYSPPPPITLMNEGGSGSQSYASSDQVTPQPSSPAPAPNHLTTPPQAPGGLTGSDPNSTSGLGWGDSSNTAPSSSPSGTSPPLTSQTLEDLLHSSIFANTEETPNGSPYRNLSSSGTRVGTASNANGSLNFGDSSAAAAAYSCEDPADYWTRTGLGDSLFIKIHLQYQETSYRWNREALHPKPQPSSSQPQPSQPMTSPIPFSPPSGPAETGPERLP